MRNKPQDNGFLQLKRTLYCSLRGVMVAWQEEGSFRKMVLLLLFLLPVAFCLPVTGWERVLLILPLFIGLQVELINTAIENVVDLATTDFHPLAKKAKDMGSAAQFVNLIMLVVIWGILLTKWV